MVCTTDWEDYLDLGKSLLKMIKHLMDEEEDENSTPKEDTAAVNNGAAQIIALPPNDDTIMAPQESLIACPEHP